MGVRISGFLWVAAEPLLFIGGVAVVRTFTQGHSEHGVPLLVVIATGYPPLVMWRSCIFNCMGALRSNYGLLFHRQVLAVDLFLARIILEIAGVLLASILCYTLFYVLGLVGLPYDWGFFCLGWLMHMWFAAASGLLIGSIGEISSVVHRTVHVFTYLWLPVGGTFFLVSWLPYSIRSYMIYAPSIDAYEVTRAGYFGPGIHFYYDIPYFVAACTVMTVIGLGIVKVAQRHMHVE